MPPSRRVVASRHGEAVGQIVPGQLIGVTMVLTGEPSPVDAVFATRGRYIRWPLQPLRRFLDSRPELRAEVLAHVKQDIARKLYGTMAGQAARTAA